MTIQSKAVETKTHKPGLPAVEPVVVADPLGELAGLARLFGGPVAVARGDLIDAQAVQLGDARFQTVQRQAMAAEIGRVQGNWHLQRVVASVVQQGSAVKIGRSRLVGIEEESEEQRAIRKADSLENQKVMALSPVQELTPVTLGKVYPGLTVQKRGKGASSPRSRKTARRRRKIQQSKNSSGLVKVKKVGQHFLLMNFACGSAKLKKEHIKFLKEIYYNVLTADPMAKIKIIGHASRTGPKKSAERLSRSRAKKVEKKLRKIAAPFKILGIDAVTGKGHTEPIGNNKKARGRARNRRVEIIVTKWKPARPVPKLLAGLQKGMKPCVVKVGNFSAVPFQRTVKGIVEKAFKSLTVVKFDWEGKATNEDHFMHFDDSTKGLKTFGVPGTVFLRSFRDKKICKIKGDPSTCEKLFPPTPDVLGRAIANTFCHELGHDLGLDHTPATDNYMWTPELHSLWGKKVLTYKERVLLGRKLQSIPSKFNGSQIVRMAHRIKEKRKAKGSGVVEFY